MTVFSLHNYNKVVTCTSKRSLKCSVDRLRWAINGKPSAVLCLPLQEWKRNSLLGSTFRHCQALAVPFTRYHAVSGYSMTNHHNTFLTGFGWLLSRHTWSSLPFALSTLLPSFCFVTDSNHCNKARGTFLIVQCHRGFWLSAVQREPGLCL